MIEAWVAAIVFTCLLGASLISMFISRVLPARHRDDDTNAVVRLIANIFVVMTSLVFGLMINSAKNTYAGIDTNVHAFATNLIILDRTLRNYGLGGVDARKKLAAYVEEAIAHPLRPDDATANKPDTAGHRLATRSPRSSRPTATTRRFLSMPASNINVSSSSAGASSSSRKGIFQDRSSPCWSRG